MARAGWRPRSVRYITATVRPVIYVLPGGGRSPRREIEMFAACAQDRQSRTSADAQFRSTVMTVLGRLPDGTLRDLAKRWPPAGSHAEQLVAELIYETMVRSAWRLQSPEPVVITAT